jgi:phage FluMu gp28-like protein
MNNAPLLPYQVRWNQDRNPVKFCEKSRRIGLSYADAAEAAVLASLKKSEGGTNTFYISYNKEMTETYIKDVADWAKRLNLAASEFEEVVLEDEDKDVLAYRVRFASGHAVIALSGKPKNLRSKQGRIIIDEAAFCEDLEELLKAAIALTMWGGTVEVISTHNGETNSFNTYILDIRAGKLPYSLHRVTLDDALAEGLYQRICQVRGLVWSPEVETAWRTGLIEFYGDGANEELFCVPSQGTGTYLTRQLIESCMSSNIPVLRWSPPADDFVDWPEERRHREMRDWLDAELGPILASLPQDARSYLGEDFGRTGDLSVYWPVVELQNLIMAAPFVLELRNCPFHQQRQALFFICDRLPRFSGAALDARGNGQYLAEVARQEYGPEIIQEVMLSETWYREHMPKLKASFEDKTILIPKDALILDDLRAFKVVKGVAKIPDARTGAKGEKRHGDAGVAAALAVFAAKCTEAEPFRVVTAAPYTSANLFRGWR